MPTNDNNPKPGDSAVAVPDAHGHAALLLVESLIHGLCENASLGAGEAAEIVERAVSVQFDHAVAADGASAPLWRSHALLTSIAASLRIEGRPE